jgi:hypothetical protein
MLKQTDASGEEVFDQTKEPIDAKALEVWEDGEMLVLAS